jgi:hypothetical protein
MCRESDFILQGIIQKHSYCWTILKDCHYIIGYGEDMESPTLAFALALEKYIDNLEKK